jgi:hypothetical protein
MFGMARSGTKVAFSFGVFEKTRSERPPRFSMGSMAAVIDRLRINGLHL